MTITTITPTTHWYIEEDCLFTRTNGRDSTTTLWYWNGGKEFYVRSTDRQADARDRAARRIDLPKNWILA